MAGGKFQIRLIALLAAMACCLPAADAWQARVPQTRPKPAAKKPASSSTSSKVLARVDGHAITQKDLDRMLLSRGIPQAAQPEAAPRLLEELIDARLLR